METSRRLRIGTRNYIIRIAATVSQEHVLLRTTRKVTRPENDIVLVLAFEINLVDAWVVEIDVISWVDLISVLGSELTWYRVGVENDLV